MEKQTSAKFFRKPTHVLGLMDSTAIIRPTPFRIIERSSLQMPNTTVSSLICWQSGHTSRLGPSLPAMTGKLEDSAVC